MSTNKANKNVVIIGASGHAKVVIDIIEQNNEYNIIGLIDSFKPINSKVFEYNIIGHEDELLALKEKYNFDTGIIAIGDNWTRKKVYKKIIDIDPNFNFISAIHPKSIIGKNVEIGNGSVIIAGAIINSDSKIGKFCIINTKASLGHDGDLKEFSSLAPNSTVGGNVKIGTCSAICIGANILQDIVIGEHSIIGGASLVNRNVDNNRLVYGIPAKVIKTIEKGEKYLYHVDDYVKPKVENEKNTSLEVITGKKGWDSLLNEIGLYDFYHTYDYHSLSKTENERPILLKYTENGLVIALPLLVRDIKGTDYKDATSVYGYAGPISNSPLYSFDNSNFKAFLLNYFNKNNFVSIFSRLNPFIPAQSKALTNIGSVINKGKVVNIKVNDDIDLQRQAFQSRLKTHINKARRHCEIKEATTDEEFNKFMDIYYENMDRVNAKKSYYFSKSYFQKIVKGDGFKSIVLLAIDIESGTTIAGSQFIISNGIVQYHLSGTKNDFLHLTPTKLLIDEMRLIASKMGLKYFNLGGGLGGRDDDSLFRFKSGFSKDFKDFNLWKLITNKKVYNELVIKRGINTESEYFPLYRYCDDIDVKL